MTGFRIAIDAFDKFTNEQMADIYLKTALDAFSEIVRRTPVDEGTAISNWQVGINTAPDTFDPESKDSKGGAKTIADGTTEILNADIEDAIYFVNNTPYIQALENGHSSQAPAGMVAVTLASFPGIVQNAAKKSP